MALYSDEGKYFGCTRLGGSLILGIPTLYLQLPAKETFAEVVRKNSDFSLLLKPPISKGFLTRMVTIFSHCFNNSFGTVYFLETSFFLIDPTRVPLK